MVESGNFSSQMYTLQQLFDPGKRIRKRELPEDKAKNEILKLHKSPYHLPDTGILLF